MATSVDICNEALELTGDQVRITALGDGTTAFTPTENACGVLYQPTVDLVARQVDPSFARRTASLTLSGAVTPIIPWAYEYLYPSDCLRLRQVRPPASPTAGFQDPENPLPIRAALAVDIISAVTTKVILSNQQNAVAVYTSNIPTVDQWDSAFREAVVRRLATPLAMAVAGRPDFSRELLAEAEQYAQLSELMDEG